MNIYNRKASTKFAETICDAYSFMRGGHDTW